MFPTCEKSVLATLAYFDLFQQPLADKEIEHFLIGKKWRRDEILNVLESSRFFQKDGFYYQLSNQPSLLASRKDHSRVAQVLWKRVERFRWIFECVPFLRLAAVCNTLAHQTPTSASDIDLFVVSKHNRLFTTRLFLTFLFHFFGVRRHGTKIAGRFCLSFFVSDNNLDFKPLLIHEEDVYFAFWMKTLEPVSGDFHVYESLLKKNQSWLSRFFHSPFELRGLHFKKNSGFAFFIKKMFEFFLRGWFGDFIENRLASWQLERAHSKNRLFGKNASSSVHISRDLLKFHHVDRRQEFYERWIARLRGLEGLNAFLKIR